MTHAHVMLAIKCLSIWAVAMILTGCATTLYSPRTGARLAHFGADCALIEYSGGGVTCRIVQHSPSKTIRASGSLVGTGLMGATSFAAVIATKGVMK